ncbi:UxaA family hydrolase [Starkeya sp. ORNL1]|uniref:UxaA family hydrolase n=1 Tax=Starkeya sp. ORNL1 TaxID=2709380 RepID=UPI001463B1FD|nr:UxaA family hydrolase [Starkeya sp. ORNL1]QJP15022.1 UxaA family hydrolase [Starkeya sp. ORNL1]
MAGAANLIVLAAGDNVGIALRDIPAGDVAATLAGLSLLAEEPIPQGHKIALHDIAAQQDVVRLGMPVAITREAIARGHLVHVHNVASRYLNNDEDHYE